MNCTHCKVTLTHKPRYTEQVGWARERDVGGVNALKLRRPTGKALCDPCGLHLFTFGALPDLKDEGQMTLQDMLAT